MCLTSPGLDHFTPLFSVSSSRKDKLARWVSTKVSSRSKLDDVLIYSFTLQVQTEDYTSTQAQASITLDFLPQGLKENKLATFHTITELAG